MEDITIVLIDDDEISLRSLEKILIMRLGVGINYVTFKNVKEAKQYIKEKKIDLIISDFSMPDEDGLDFFYHVKKHYNIPFIFYTGHLTNEEMKVMNEKYPHVLFIRKPWSGEQYIDEIRVLLNI
jgi:DNA-binding NtrC family response regulator